MPIQTQLPFREPQGRVKCQPCLSFPTRRHAPLHLPPHLLRIPVGNKKFGAQPPSAREPGREPLTLPPLWWEAAKRLAGAQGSSPEALPHGGARRPQFKLSVSVRRCLLSDEQGQLVKIGWLRCSLGPLPVPWVLFGLFPGGSSLVASTDLFSPKTGQQIVFPSKLTISVSDPNLTQPTHPHDGGPESAY